MDELKLNLKSKVMRMMLKKLLSKAIQDKFGRDIHVEINTIDLSVGEKARLHIDANVETGGDEFVKIIKEIGLL